jgi:hypothetical protein
MSAISNQIIDLPIAKNLTQEEKNRLCNKIEKTKDLLFLQEHFKPYEGPFWKKNNYQSWPICALARRIAKEINATQLATICFYSAVVDQFIKRTQSYNMDIDANGVVKYDVIDKGERPSNIEWVHYSDKRFERILIRAIGADQNSTEDRVFIHSIIKGLENAPLSEQYVFMIEGVNDLNSHSNLLSTLKELRTPFHGSIFLLGRRMFVAPSFTILKLFFQTIRPDFPVKFTFIFGSASTDNIIEARVKNKRLVSLPIGEINIPSITDKLFAGKAGSIIHDGCYHAFLLSSLTTGENKAIIYLINDLLPPYISKKTQEFENAKKDFYSKNHLNEFQQKSIKKLLKITNIEMDLFMKGKQLFEEDYEQFEDLRPIIDKILKLKILSIKLRAAKRFRWLIADGELWKNFSNKSKDTWNPLFTRPPLKSLFTLDPSLLDLIILDMQNNAQFWRSKFGIEKKHFQEGLRLQNLLQIANSCYKKPKS